MSLAAWLALHAGVSALATWLALVYARRRKLFDAPATYEKVTPEQIKALAARLLTVNNRTVGVLVPVMGEEGEGE